MELHLGFAVKIVTICAKKKIINLMQPQIFCDCTNSLEPDPAADAQRKKIMMSFICEQKQ